MKACTLSESMLNFLPKKHFLDSSEKHTSIVNSNFKKKDNAICFT